MSFSALDAFEIKVVQAPTWGWRLLGILCVPFAILFRIAALILISPFIFVVFAVNQFGNRINSGRKAASWPRPDLAGHIPPIIEGQYEVIDIGRISQEPESNGERLASAQR